MLFGGILSTVAAVRTAARLRAGDIQPTYKNSTMKHLFGADEVAPSDQAKYTRIYSQYGPLWKLLNPEANRKVRLGNLRLNLLPAVRQPPLREAFRKYVDTRLAVSRNVGNPEIVERGLARTKAIQDEIWSQSVVACAEVPSVAVTTLVLTSLNAMIDITTTLAMAARTHLPWLITVLLVILPLVCALLAGIDAAPSHGSLVRMISFALILAMTVYVILDLEYPRVGLVRIDMFDQGLVELRKSM
jgi:hypothetical protein